MRSREIRHQIAPESTAQILAALSDVFRENISGQGSEYADANATRKLAEKGHAGAQTHLGHMYYFGHGVPKNHAEARK
jgi:TPR repeat protein